MEWEYEVKLQ
jgi:hypothetical protein